LGSRSRSPALRINCSIILLSSQIRFILRLYLMFNSDIDTQKAPTRGRLDTFTSCMIIFQLTLKHKFVMKKREYVGQSG
jgi:hypothetical protein